MQKTAGNRAAAFMLSSVHPKLCVSGHQDLIGSQETLYGKKIVVADRDMVEAESDVILENADKEDVAFLVVGDPFG